MTGDEALRYADAVQEATAAGHPTSIADDVLVVLAAKVRQLQAETTQMGRTWVAEVDELRAEVRRLHTWEGLMSLLDEHYPPDVPLGPDSDPGPRILRLTRELNLLKLVVEQLRPIEQRAIGLAGTPSAFRGFTKEIAEMILGRPLRSDREGEPRGEDGGQ